MVWMTASRLKLYSLSALRNSASLAAMRRIMPSTSTGAPERLMVEGAFAAVEAGVCAAACGEAAEPTTAAARTEKITLFIGFFEVLTTEKEFRRGLYRKI